MTALDGQGKGELSETSTGGSTTWAEDREAISGYLLLSDVVVCVRVYQAVYAGLCAHQAVCECVLQHLCVFPHMHVCVFHIHCFKYFHSEMTHAHSALYRTDLHFYSTFQGITSSCTTTVVAFQKIPLNRGRCCETGISLVSVCTGSPRMQSGDNVQMKCSVAACRNGNISRKNRGERKKIQNVIFH